MNKFIIKLINAYKKNKNHNYKYCKYEPTCSSYALDCFEKFNFFKALGLSIYRILRCNPFSHGGYDPTPKSFVEKNFDKFEEVYKNTSR